MTINFINFVRKVAKKMNAIRIGRPFRHLRVSRQRRSAAN
jgi:hypothetical protein